MSTTDPKPLLRALVVGINANTRALEGGKLKLLVVFRDVQNPPLQQHLLELTSSASVPICSLLRGSSDIGKLLACKRVSAIGFTKVPAHYRVPKQHINKSLGTQSGRYGNSRGSAVFV